MIEIAHVIIYYTWNAVFLFIYMLSHINEIITWSYVVTYLLKLHINHIPIVYYKASVKKPQPLSVHSFVPPSLCPDCFNCQEK